MSQSAGTRIAPRSTGLMIWSGRAIASASNGTGSTACRANSTASPCADLATSTSSVGHVSNEARPVAGAWPVNVSVLRAISCPRRYATSQNLGRRRVRVQFHGRVQRLADAVQAKRRPPRMAPFDADSGRRFARLRGAACRRTAARRARQAAAATTASCWRQGDLEADKRCMICGLRQYELRAKKHDHSPNIGPSGIGNLILIRHG